MVDIKSEQQFDELIQKNDLVLVDFWASWCGPCMQLKPRIEKLLKDRDDVKLFKVNVDENKELAQRYQVQSIPVLLLFKFGELRAGLLGNKPDDVILQMIDDEKNPPQEKQDMS